MRAYVGAKTPGRHTADGSQLGIRALREGSISVADFLVGAGYEGRIFGVNAGSVGTPIASAATTAIAAQRPMAWVRVPDGTLIIPLYASIVVESTGATTQGEIAMATSQNDVGNGTSTAITPVSLNAAAPKTTNCTARRSSTGDCTAETNLHEVTRWSFAASAVDQRFTWTFKDSGVPLILRGAASWLVYIGGNAVNSFTSLIWVELPEEDAN